MPDKSFRDVLYFTLAWGALATVMIAAEPGPLVHGMPGFVKPAQAGESPAAQKGPEPARVRLASVMESAE